MGGVPFGLGRWWRRPRGPSVEPTRWVVVDVETTGLDPRRDRLLAIAAVAVEVGGGGPVMPVGDTFEVVLRHPAAQVDKANILVHHIGVGAQRAGMDPVAALEAFERWVADSPLVAFHAAFDEAVIGRAMQQHLGRSLRPPWVDLAEVAPVVRPEVRARSLDDWMAQTGIVCAQRHQAAADTWATAELLARLWPAICRQSGAGNGPLSHRALREMAANQRWLAASR